MFDKLCSYFDLPVRALMATIFILSGFGKISAFQGTQGYMEAYGVPGALLAPTIVFEIGAGLLLLFGLWIRQVSFLLAGFTLVSALIFHMDSTDQIQQMLLLKNLAMVGGFLLLAKQGAPDFSIDKFRSR